MNWLAWRHRLEYAAFRLFECLAQMLSPQRARELAESLGFVLHRVLPRKWTRYDVAFANLRQALGPDASEETIDGHIRKMWVHLIRMAIEIMQLHRKVRTDNILDIVRYGHGRDDCWRAFNSGRPVIVVGGHFGNWEVANTLLGLFGIPMGIIARNLDNPYLHAYFQRFRESTGHRLFDRDNATEQMLPMLEQRGYIGLLCDQDAGTRRGIFVDFFGKPASTYKSIALVACQTRALICVAGAYRLPDELSPTRTGGPAWSRFELVCEEVIDPLQFDGLDAIQEITQRYTNALERLIRRAPEQYFWVHRRWKTPAGARRGKARRRAAA
jgi:KDO2-lipid IV(A) lauroyltransferase